MVVVALLAVLAGLAAPSFSDAVRRRRERNAAEELISALQLARIEAQRTGQDVVLRANPPCAQNTPAEEWRCGWSLFSDLNRNHLLDSGEPVLQFSSSSSTTWLRRDGLANQAEYVTINRFGGLPPSLGISVFGTPEGSADGNAGLRVCASVNRLRISESGAC